VPSEAWQPLRERLILFTRYPEPGRTKTRLIPVLGERGAAGLQRQLTLRALRAGARLSTVRGTPFEIHFTGGQQSAMEHWLGDRFVFRPQSEGDLGNRMQAAFDEGFRAGAHAVVLIGADCPELSPELLAEAFDRLRSNPVVLGPANDGGYYLVGLGKPVPGLFSGPVWGSSTVLAHTLAILERLGHTASLLRPLSDIDRPEDLAVWERLNSFDAATLEKVSVIIPALNEEQQIAATIAAAQKGKPHEILLVDGGSRDQTVRRATEAGARVLRSRPGRARQMNAGAAMADGNSLLFLHADTLLPERYCQMAAQTLADYRVSIGAFRLAIGDAFGGRRFVEVTANLRARWAQLPYGDQALFLSRALFEKSGGFADLPIMEDYELVRRLRREGRIVTLDAPAVTSGRRWRELGLLRTTLLNLWMVFGYHAGWPMPRLATAYRKLGRRSLTDQP
jgi:rSAM/selenodomain-associated transferase 2/rSAM/selenodomain-associated transferase 1